MLYERVTIKRDTQTTYSREVPEWEIPILEFIFEEGNVVRTGTFIDVTKQYAGKTIRVGGDEERVIRDDAGYPASVAEEFDRLVRAYGSDPQSGVPYVASVYGQASAGVRALGRAIQDAKAVESEKKPKPASARKTRKSAEADSLLA